MKPKSTATATAGATTKVQNQTQAVQKPKAAPAFKITSLEDEQVWFKMLVYGDYGVGKTRLLASCTTVEEMNDVLFINAEKGTLTLRDVPWDTSRIDVVNVDTFKQISQVHEFLEIHCRHRDSETEESEEVLWKYQKALLGDSKRLRRYKSVVLDTLTEAETFSMYQILGVNDSTKMEDLVMAQEWAEYRQNQHMILRLMRKFRDLPMHIFFGASEGYNQDEKKRMFYTPQMTGQLSKKVQGFMDVVGRLVVTTAGEDNSVVRQLWVQPVGRFNAKCRFSKFKGTHFEDPTVSKILDAVGFEV